MAKVNHPIIVPCTGLSLSATSTACCLTLRHDWKPGGLQAAGGDRQAPLQTDPGGVGLPAQQEHHPPRHQAGEHPAGRDPQEGCHCGLWSEQLLGRQLKIEDSLWICRGEFQLFLASASPYYLILPQYAAPEIFDRQSAYTQAVDMWSLGVSLYAMSVTLNETRAIHLYLTFETKL